MKKVMILMLAVAAFAAFGEIYTIGLSGNKDAITRNGKVVALDVISTDATAAVTVSVIRAVSSYTNCVKIAVVTNGIGEVATVTNRWMGLKEAKVYTNVLGSATCAGGVGQADVNKYIFGGDAVIATGINKPGETIKAKLVIENK